jgi:hypothetical protein
VYRFEVDVGLDESRFVVLGNEGDEVRPMKITSIVSVGCNGINTA